MAVVGMEPRTPHKLIFIVLGLPENGYSTQEFVFSPDNRIGSDGDIFFISFNAFNPECVVMGITVF